MLLDLRSSKVRRLEQHRFLILYCLSIKSRSVFESVAGHVPTLNFSDLLPVFSHSSPIASVFSEKVLELIRLCLQPCYFVMLGRRSFLYVMAC